MYPGNASPPHAKPRKKLGWLAVAGVIWLVISVAAVLYVVTLDYGAGKAKLSSKGFRTTYAETVPSYAGNPVYDACGLVTMDTVAKHVSNYQDSLELVGTGKRPTEPLTISHQYVDRDLPAALGKDGQPRPVTTTIGLGFGAGPNLDNFRSLFDSNCEYGQGVAGKSTFAKVFVTQKPTPLAPELSTFLSTFQGEKKQVSGLDIYLEAQPDATRFYGALVIDQNRGVAAFIDTNKPEFRAAAVAEAAKVLAQAPKGPVEISYPAPYAKISNPCGLLSATDFESLTQKPASALAEETLNLNETSDVGGQAVRRTCERFEVDRFTNEVAKTSVALEQWKDSKSLDDYLDFLRTDGDAQIKDTKEKVGDASFVKVGKNLRGAETYSFYLRVGSKLVALNVGLDVPSDTSSETYEARMLPAAKIVAQNLTK